ncbi:HD domain-containing protein [Desulfobotulus mexicanus]|uniref:HD domain-containing protein n=1 Tax=Desulfobotulus mexicanus TaxID=2586642 RepID=A0A5S5MDC9_9BACT|nr:HD domain-containing protein [Desulfobotulus mexicanus]TYT73635.1 HD domain-containing protein [Desulfobotulus mexicanus]
MEIYTVGGAIRDKLMGRAFKDRDFLVLGAKEADFIKAFPSARKQGKQTPVYRVGGDEYILSHTDNIHDDLLGRDLTINAMAEDEGGRLYHHPMALKDLKEKILRPVRRENFMKDPLRVFRAARFTSLFPDYAPAPELLETMRETAFLLEGISPERVGSELLIALSGENPSRFFRILAETGCLDPWFSEMKKAMDVPAGPVPWHRGSLFEHIMDVTDELHGSRLLAWMALCHDLGKLATPKEKWPSHHGHDGAGEPMARAFARRLRLSRRFEDAGSMAARLHMKAGLYGRLRPGSRVDLLLKLHRADLVDALFYLVRADHGEDFLERVKRDLELMFSVRLPTDHGLEGVDAGRRLRDLRCQALAGRCSASWGKGMLQP